MSFNVELTNHFKNEAKRLSRKYRSLKSELSELFDELENNPTLGTPLGQDVFKIRLGIASKGKGKSGGARVVIYVIIDESTVLLLAIYDKANKSNITVKEIKDLMDEYGR